MIDTFLKAVGFDPAEFAAACEYYKKEFEMMKTGLQGAVGHFNGELVALRKENAELKEGQAVVNANILRIERLLELNLVHFHKQELTSNGHANGTDKQWIEQPGRPE